MSARQETDAWEICRDLFPRSARRFALALVLAVIAMLAQAPRAHATVAWRDGLIFESYTLNCLFQTPEYGIGAFVGQLYDSSYAEPYVGERFYMRIHIAGLGHPCADNYIDVQFVPPAGVTVSSVDSYPVRCFYQAPGSAAYSEIGTANGCPQPPYGVAANSAGTGYRIDRRQPVDPLPAWFLPGGGAYEFWIPVMSDRPLDGLQTSMEFTAPVQAIDGVYNYWIYPWQTVYVASGPDQIFVNHFE
jgi:hypothetical protein